MSISVLINTFRRPHLIQEQVDAVLGQTVKPARVVVWHNGPDPAPEVKGNVERVTCTTNWGVWARFYHCLNFTTPHICVFDDDTIPGSKWFENCLAHCSKRLLGARGVIFPRGSRNKCQGRGVHNQSEKLERADIVGHCWFFDRANLDAFIRAPRMSHTTCGEDYCMAFAAQQIGYEVACPPYPQADREMHGSLTTKHGCDRVALASQGAEARKKHAVHAFYKSKGFRFIS